MQSWKQCDQIHLCYEFNELLSGKNTSKTKTNELKELVFFFFLNAVKLQPGRDKFSVKRGFKGGVMG